MATQENYYYALFEKDEGGTISVHVPDVDACITFGDNWDEAYENAIDALAGCLAAGAIPAKRSTREELAASHPGCEIDPVPVDRAIMAKYEPAQRINITLAAPLLHEVDAYCHAANTKRSRLLANAVQEYMTAHPAS